MARRVLTVNGGSATVKFAVFDGDRRVAKWQVNDADAGAGNLPDGPFDAIGHRVVHGGIKLNRHQIVTDDLIAELCRARALDPAHLPREIKLIQAFRDRFPEIPQVACFDTVFHHDLPRVAQMLPIPRHYFEAGVRRLGFHGLSYAYLVGQLGLEAKGRVIIAHLGSGASMAAIREGVPLDTTMGFTPEAGLVMGTRPGDLDPGLLVYLMRTENLSPEAMDEFVSKQCGLTGISGGTPDMRELVARRAHDQAAGDAFDAFCYTARKWMGAYTAVLAGLDTLVFSGGIGEHSPDVRASICEGFEFLGLQLDVAANASNADLISTPESRVKVRVIPTDEEKMIAQIVSEILQR